MSIAHYFFEHLNNESDILWGVLALAILSIVVLSVNSATKLKKPK
jgi:bacteriorhodopsin